MKHRKSAMRCRAPVRCCAAERIRDAALTEVLALRRKLVDPDKLREIGQAYRHYDAGLFSRWDSYEGAIEAAED